MKSPEFIQTKLEARANASRSSFEVKHNRYHYSLVFTESIGVSWLYAQVQKASAETETPLELWEVHPGSDATFEAEVRETNRREGIDDNQNSLSSFQKS